MTVKLGHENAIHPNSPPVDGSSLTLADLTFLTCIERTELGEAWKVSTPGGKVHLCQFLPPTELETTLELLGRLRAIRHRTLVPWIALPGERNRLALLYTLDGPTLWDRFQELWAANQPGVPREELLDYLRVAAAALDSLQSRHKVQHLWLQPRHLVIQEDRAQILGFGLAESWWVRTARPSADLNPRYSAPELRRRTRGIQCDQYSLALIYAEMLTGRHPWRGRTGTEAARNPDLDLLTRNDRAVIQRALSPDHRRRFDSATDMVEALENAASTVVLPPPLRSLLAPPELGLAQASSLFPCDTVDQFVHELVRIVAGSDKTPDELKIRFILEPSERLEWPRFLNTDLDTLPVFDDFCRQWHAKTMHRRDGLVILAINAAPSIWQWLLGRRLGLEVRLAFRCLPWGKKAEVVVTVKPFGCGQEQATRLLTELGPKLLQSVRAYLHAQPEQRRRERLAVRQRVRVCPVINGTPANPIECVTKDISTGGIGFYFPLELQAYQVYVNLPEMEMVASHAALAQVVRKQPAEDGWIEVGATFPIFRGDRAEPPDHGIQFG